MPKLNKCIHRKEVHGFIRSYGSGDKRYTKFSSRIWFQCKLKGNDDSAKTRCTGRNCGNYKEEDDQNEQTKI